MESSHLNGQVAQLVERGPEKAGVGGSSPSLATKINNLHAVIFRFGCNWLHFCRRFLIPRPLLLAFAGSPHARTQRASVRLSAPPAMNLRSKPVACVSERSGTREVYVANVDGSGLEQRTFLEGAHVLGLRWSPDGTRLAFASDLGGSYDIQVIPANGGEPERLTFDPADDIRKPKRHPPWRAPPPPGAGSTTRPFGPS